MIFNKKNIRSLILILLLILFFDQQIVFCQSIFSVFEKYLTSDKIILKKERVKEKGIKSIKNFFKKIIVDKRFAGENIVGISTAKKVKPASASIVDIKVTKKVKSIKKKNSNISAAKKVKPAQKKIVLTEIIRELKSSGDVKNYLPYVQLGGTQFFNTRNNNTAINIDLFIPIWQISTDLIFVDIRTYDRLGKSFEGNLHFGYRHLLPEKQILYGIYGAFDSKRTSFGNYFNQLILGGEYWIKNWFIGGNIYKTIGDTLDRINNKYAEEAKVQQNGIYKNILITTDSLYERAMSGIDAEVGYEFTKGLTGYVGGYYFGAKGVNTVLGPRARLAYDWSLDNDSRILGIFDKIGLEGGVQKDKPRGTTWYLSINFRIGWLPEKQPVLSGVSRHMIDPVRRDIDIVSVESIVRAYDFYKNPFGEILNIREVASNQEFDDAMVDDNTYVISVYNNHKLNFIDC